MMTRAFIRIVLSVALMCGSFAWTGWAYLHTAADPHRVEVISTAVLSDPAARREIAVPLADQIIRQTGIDPTNAPAIRDAVAATMTDPRITTNIIAAFGSAQSKAFGVPDPRPTTIDGIALVTAVRDKLATTNPDLASHIPVDAIGNIHLPDLQVPFTTTLRRLAQNCTKWLAMIAIALLALCLLLGDRKHVLRRYGTWAIVTGAMWVIGPRLIVFAAHRWAHPVDATISAAVKAGTKSLTGAASLLMITGIAALVLRQFAWLGAALPDGESLPEPRNRRARRGMTRVVDAPVSGVWLTPQRHPDATGPVWQPTAATPVQDVTGVVTRQAGNDRFPWDDGSNATTPAPDLTPELDPWAHFAGPAPAAGFAIPNSFVPNGAGTWEPSADSAS